MTGWWFIAVGAPAPQGSKSFRGFAGNGKAILAESSRAVAPWRQVVTLAALAARRAGAVPLIDGPVLVTMVFTIRRPKGATRADIAPGTRPDLDKYARATFDGITDAGLWGDDGQVARLNAGKVWAGYSPDALQVPGARVVCVPMTAAGGAKAEHDLLLAESCAAHPAPALIDFTQGARP